MEPSTSHERGGLSEAVEPPAVLLVETPRFDERDTTACIDLLTANEPEAEKLLIVSVTETIGKTHRRWDDHVGEHPSEFAVVSASFAENVPGDGAPDSGATGSGAPDAVAAGSPTKTAEPGTAGESAASWLTAHEVGDPGDLTGLGVTISSQLSEWTDAEEQAVVCFRSLTTTLQYVETEELVRFLSELRTHVEAAGAIAHFHLDPAAIDSQTQATIRSVADAAVVGDDESGGVELLQ
ncbi:DUF7504 family protein [Salinarchaeum laminariae]|uniref:DUF7504 family protein n=1 Tax=Salinarchaeum laminariae TaxID=869888 RepID=UPI0020BE4BC4|nr:hypothetical protein [Salinarchaeum laminariae]